jgi:polar amino acid transport system substrate-binding protein
MTVRRSRSLATTAVAIAAALVFAACSSSPSATQKQASPPAPTTTTAPAPAVTCAHPTASFAPDTSSLTPGSVPPGSFMATVQKRGYLTAAVSADTLLFGFRNPFSGQLEGFDIDVIHQIANEIFGDPNKVSFKVVTYGQRIPSLQDGSADIVADVMTINCARWEKIDFSSEYFHAGQKVLVRKDSTARGIGDLNGKKVCAAEGSTNIDNLKSYPKVIAVPVPDISDCMVLFQQGTVDAVTGDDTVLAGFTQQDPYAKIVGPEFTDEPYGLGIAKTHPDFVRYVNAVLEQMRRDGTWARLYEKWLHTAPPAPPAALYGREP